MKSRYKGEATIVSRKARQDENGNWVPYGEPTSIRRETNVILYRKIEDEINDLWPSQTTLHLWVDEQKMPIGEAVSGYFGNDTAIQGTDIGGVDRWVYTDAVGMVDGFWTVSQRFDPPPASTTRNVWSIMLGAASGTLDEDGVLAYIGLSAVCTQSDVEILDIFYRITIDTTAPSGTFNGQFPWASTRGTELAWDTSGPNNFPESWGAIASPVLDGPLPSNFAEVTKADLSILTTSGQVEDESYMSFTDDASLDLASSVGLIMAGMVFGHSNNEISGAVKILRPGDTPIQNLFGKDASSVVPFLDAGNAATGSGSVTLNGDSWTGDNSTRERWQYRIDITGSGEVGVGTYQFSRRRLAGGYSANTYASKAMSLHSMRTWLAGSNQKQSATTLQEDDTMHGFGVTVFPSSMPHRINETGPSGDQPGYRWVAGREYGFPEVIFYDDTGLTIFNVETDEVVEHIDTNSSPALDVTDISSVEFESDGTIWVASRAEGLYRITRTRLTGVTAIDRMTGGGLASVNDDTVCVAVAIKRSTDDIWGLFDGGLAQSTDGGATWTVFNEGTATEFLLTGFTGVGEWVNFSGMWIDPTHADDNLAFGCPGFVDNEGGSTNAGRAAWWSRANSNPTSDAVFTGNNGNGDALAYRAGSTRGVYFHEDGVLLHKSANGNNTLVERVWGNTGTGTTNSSNAPVLDDALIIIPDSSGNELVVGTESSGQDTYLARTIAQLNTASGLDMGPSNGALIKQGESILNTINGTLLYAGKGYLLSSSEDDSSGVFDSSNNHFVLMIGVGTEPLGGDLEHEIWEHFGWTGAAWVQDDAGSKTIAAGPEALIDGLTITFADGGGAPHFVSTEFYTVGVMDAVWKDDATSFDLDITFPWSQIETGTTFTPSTVPGTDVGSVSNERPSWYAESVPLYQEPGSASFSSSNGHATAEQLLPSDFRLDCGLASLAGSTGANQGFGVGICTQGNAATTTAFTTASMLHSMHIRREVDGVSAGVDSWHLEIYEGASNVHSEEMTDYDPQVDTFAIERIGTTITYERNASVVYTSLNSSSGTRALKLVATNQGGLIYDALLDYVANERRAVVGNGTTSGINNSNFRVAHVPLMVSNAEITIAATPATILTDPWATPSAGEVVLRRNGQLVFNSADATSAIAGDWIVQLKNNLV